METWSAHLEPERWGDSVSAVAFQEAHGWVRQPDVSVEQWSAGLL